MPSLQIPPWIARGPNAAGILGVSGGGYRALGADFDGTNDLLTRGADLTGSANGKTALFSCWFRKDGGDGAIRALLSDDSGRNNFIFLGGNTFRARAQASGSVTILDISTTATFTASTTWHHFLISYDVGTVGRRHIFVDDVEDTNQTTFTDDTIARAGNVDWGVGGKPAASQLFNGCLAEFYYTQEWFDISVEANRRKFISPSLKPVSLGADGSKPTGTAPLIYETFKELDGTNSGSGGDFSVTGTIDRCLTSPSN